MAIFEVLEKLKKSKFRASFKLRQKDIDYINEKGFEVIKKHAFDFVSKRLAPAVIENDGKQTPTKGHPVFPAQHACACCCRGCLAKWHKFEVGKDLTEEQISYIVDVLMCWIHEQYDNFKIRPSNENCKQKPQQLLLFDLK